MWDLRKRNAIVHVFAKLVFFSFSKSIKENQNSFLLILFAKKVNIPNRNMNDDV